MLKRIILLLTVAALMVAMMAANAGPASAQEEEEGCRYIKSGDSPLWRGVGADCPLDLHHNPVIDFVA